MKLKDARIRKGLTQLEVSQRLGVSLITVQRWEYYETKTKQYQRMMLSALYELPIETIEWESKNV